MKKIIKYVWLDILRSRTIIGYTVLLALISFSVFNLESNSAKGILTLLNLVLIIVPLVSIVFATIYLYNAAEFIELLVAQPLPRGQLWLSMYTGLAMALSVAFLAGCGVPVLLYAPDTTGFTLLLTGWALSLIFVAIAMLSAVLTRDKARGIGWAVLLWFYFTLIYDGLILFLLFQFMDYPMEKPMIAFSLLNPVDLARIMILLKLDVSVLMGATSAVFRDFFGGLGGTAVAATVLLLWTAAPLWVSLRNFKRKDL
jgi:Cu-processing system permease protein